MDKVENTIEKIENKFTCLDLKDIDTRHKRIDEYLKHLKYDFVEHKIAELELIENMIVTIDDLNYFQKKFILGEIGWTFNSRYPFETTEYINDFVKLLDSGLIIINYVMPSIKIYAQKGHWIKEINRKYLEFIVTEETGKLLFKKLKKSKYIYTLIKYEFGKKLSKYYFENLNKAETPFISYKLKYKTKDLKSANPKKDGLLTFFNLYKNIDVNPGKIYNFVIDPRDNEFNLSKNILYNAWIFSILDFNAENTEMVDDILNILQ